jgi:Ras family protein A
MDKVRFLSMLHVS